MYSKMSLRLDICVCTHNPNYERFYRVLNAISQKTLEKNLWRVIIVDNNSSPSISDQQMKTLRERDVQYLLVREPVLGIISARRKAISQAIAPWLLFVDDDNYLSDDYLLGEIFAKRPKLAATWLDARIKEAQKNKDQVSGFKLERAFGIAANSLKFEERQLLLNTISSFPHDYLIVRHLVGNNIELYKELLANKNLKHLHLDPLYGKSTDTWTLKVIAALDSGYAASEIVHATIWGSMRIVSWSGNESAMWDGWIRDFEPFLQHSDERIREVAKIAIESISLARDKALRGELQEEVFGRN